MLPLLNKDRLVEARDLFIKKQKIAPGVHPQISASWKRCWSRLNPDQSVKAKALSPGNFLATQVASFVLISLARPIMEDIYQYVESSECLVILTNSAGYIIDMLGDSEMLVWCEHVGIKPGSLLSEGEIGTNAFASCIIDRMPARVVGAEHYLSQFQDLAEAAAPIFDLTGRPIGALGLVTKQDGYHAHTLGLAVGGVRAVEGQLQADHLLAEQHSNLDKLNAVLEASTDGILVVDSEGVLMLINDAALGIFGQRRGDVMGRKINETIGYPAFIRSSLYKGEPLTDVETTVKVGEKLINCILSLRYIHSEGVVKWVIATVRQEKHVRELVQSQLGTQAPLTIDDIPGRSDGIQRVQRFVRAAAPAKASILIRGESGTGKNVLASAIHNASPRRDGPFLIIGCTSIPHEWVISELLGFDESFSSKRPGGRPSKFELAHGGTIFFQNVDDLPMDAQAILLNYLDLGIVQRLGSDRPIQLDVRVIASTSSNIEKLISQGDFRPDLYYRLSSFEITLPPLRERSGDVPLLTNRILDRISRQLGRKIQVDAGSLELLRSYRWPGNLRELEAILGRAAVQTDRDGMITPSLLPVELTRKIVVSSDGANVILPLREMERETLVQAAEACQGNASEMAKLLGIGRTTIWRRAKDFNISFDHYRTRKTTT